MVDPVSLGTVAAALLASKLGGRLAKDSGSGSWREVSGLREAIADKLGRGPETPTALAALAENPTQQNQAAVAELVASAARSDPDFAAKMQRLLVAIAAIAGPDEEVELVVWRANDNAIQINISGKNVGTIDLDDFDRAWKEIAPRDAGAGDYPVWWFRRTGFTGKGTGGVASADLPEGRCVIYLDTDDESRIRAVLDAVVEALGEHGLELEPQGSPRYGSWFARFKVRAKDAVDNPDVHQRLQKLEQAIEVKTLHGPMSQVNLNQADATLRLAQAVGSIDNAALLIGSLLVIKTTASDGSTSMIARSLSVAEIRALEANQHVLKDPQYALSRLEDLTRPNHASPVVLDSVRIASLTDESLPIADQLPQPPPDI